MKKTYLFDLTKIEEEETIIHKPCLCSLCLKKENEIRQSMDYIQRGEVPVEVGGAVREAPRFATLEVHEYNLADWSLGAPNTTTVTSTRATNSALRNGLSPDVSGQTPSVRRNQRAANRRMEVEGENISSTLSPSDIQRII